jgi:hypothetical protein
MLEIKTESNISMKYNNAFEQAAFPLSAQEASLD